LGTVRNTLGQLAELGRVARPGRGLYALSE